MGRVNRAAAHNAFWVVKRNAVLCVYASVKLHGMKDMFRLLEPEIDYLSSRVNRAEFIYQCRRAQAVG